MIQRRSILLKSYLVTIETQLVHSNIRIYQRNFLVMYLTMALALIVMTPLVRVAMCMLNPAYILKLPFWTLRVCILRLSKNSTCLENTPKTSETWSKPGWQLNIRTTKRRDAYLEVNSRSFFGLIVLTLTILPELFHILSKLSSTSSTD